MRNQMSQYLKRTKHHELLKSRLSEVNVLVEKKKSFV